MRRVPASTSERLSVFAIFILVAVTVGGLAAPAGASASTNLSLLERRVLAYVNAERDAHGLPAVRPQGDLMSAARAHSRSMAHQPYFSHYSLSGAPFSLRLLSFGYGRGGFAAWGVGENIATARADTVGATPAGVVGLWMQSSAHRSVMLDSDFREVGIGIHLADGSRYFTLDLGYRRP